MDDATVSPSVEVKSWAGGGWVLEAGRWRMWMDIHIHIQMQWLVEAE